MHPLRCLYVLRFLYNNATDSVSFLSIYMLIELSVHRNELINCLPSIN